MRLKIAIQKSGRLLNDSLQLLKDCGIHVSNGNKLRSESTNFPLEVYFLRDDDIPQYVEDGVADVGIVGENLVYEKKKQVQVKERLGFGLCRLSLAVGKNEAFSMQWLRGKKIATSYPVLLKEYLDKHSLDAEIHEISGSVEIAPGIGLADAICDLVSSGSTLLTNGLKEVETILHSQAVLISNPSPGASRISILEKLLFRIRAVKKASSNKYILLNAPDSSLEAITKLLPGMKSPTVLPLATVGWSSVHSVVREDDFWEIIEQLKQAGAEGILVMPIEKMIV